MYNPKLDEIKCKFDNTARYIRSELYSKKLKCITLNWTRLNANLITQLGIYVQSFIQKS